MTVGVWFLWGIKGEQGRTVSGKGLGRDPSRRNGRGWTGNLSDGRNVKRRFYMNKGWNLTSSLKRETVRETRRFCFIKSHPVNISHLYITRFNLSDPSGPSSTSSKTADPSRRRSIDHGGRTWKCTTFAVCQRESTENVFVIRVSTTNAEVLD